MNIWTRDLSSEEMREFLDYMDSLVPPYVLCDAQRADKINSGGRLYTGFHPEHRNESVYVKMKWG